MFQSLFPLLFRRYISFVCGNATNVVKMELNGFLFLNEHVYNYRVTLYFLLQYEQNDNTTRKVKEKK